jgi:hypothetical protein
MPAHYLDVSAVEAATPISRKSDKLHVGVASNIEQVIEAWQLVYHSYRRINIIDENPLGIHTNSHVIHPDMSVVMGELNGESVSTLTIMPDSERGLPLDRVYNRQLNMLRRLGRPIVEVGLLADRREKAGRALAAIMEMMRYVFWNARFHGADILCGVHPHHADFYIKTFGFGVIGPVVPYPTVKNQFVVLLRLDLEHQLKLHPLPRGLEQYDRVQPPLHRHAFDTRCKVNVQTIANTPIHAFLHRCGQLDANGVVTNSLRAPIWRQLDQQALVA